MGNCQAIDAAMLVIQHQNGKEDKLYWPVTANEIMKANPNYYVALLITSSLCPTGDGGAGDNADSGEKESGKKSSRGGGLVRVTRVKVLRPTDTLVLGQVYRLITTQEVMKGLRAKKQAKMMKKNCQSESVENGGGNSKEHVSAIDLVVKRSEKDKNNQANKNERTTSPVNSNSNSNSNSTKTRSSWQPSLQSISEGGS